MMHRPQRTEDAQRLEARTARTLGLHLLRGLGGELNQWPRAQPSGSRLLLKREHGAYRCCVLPRHGERARCGTGRAAQQCTRRARGTGCGCGLAALPPQGDGGSCSARSEAESTRRLHVSRAALKHARVAQQLGAAARGRGVPFSPAPGDNSLRSVLNSQHQQLLSDLLTAAASSGGGLPCSNRSNRTKVGKVS